MKGLICFCLLLSWATTVAAQEGPQVPCVGCDTLIQAPYPETGAWYNPDQSGTGINIEVQDGYLVGYYYGYTVDGFPEWHIIHGPLVRSEQEGVLWELESYMQYYHGGNCIGCDYQPPMSPTNGPAVKLEFLQRNHLRFTISDNSSQFYVPIIYGSMGGKFFEEQTPYVFPEYGYPGDGFLSGAPFVLILRPNSDPPEPWNWISVIGHISRANIPQSGPYEGSVTYSIARMLSGIEIDPFANIECSLDESSDQPGCRLLIDDFEFLIPIGNMSDSRFFGEAKDGSTIEGYRLDYD